ncbi:hypothetical protein [Rhodococcus rhodochrous]|uniref:hypothetical protein n=1 Tax=Rhodococcus rhodochrous TaxID=1829 RepID=UPI000A91CCEA|nr:hypothetical protein [Rhodococcus rhodochrous]
MTSQSVIAVYELPRPIWVTYDILGKRFDTHIGPVRVTVVTPELDPPTGRIGPPAFAGLPDGALGPILGERPPRLDAYPSFAEVIDPEWCTEYAANHPGRATALRTVGLELVANCDPQLDRLSAHTYLPDKLLDIVGRYVEDWYTRLAEWVSVLTGQDLNHHHQIYPARLLGPGLRAWGGNNWRSTSSTYDIPSVRPIEPDQWRTVLHRIGEGRRPPLEWQLILAGASALDRGHNRRAVIDFATAIEVCLTRLVQDSTSSANRPGDKSTLPNWSEWLDAHEPAYKADEGFADLVDLRNETVHRGINPSYEQARAAYECASRVVSTHGRDREECV